MPVRRFKEEERQHMETGRVWPAPALLLFLPGTVRLLPRVVRLAVLCPSGKIFLLNVYAEGSTCTRQVRTAVLPGQTFTPLCLSLLWPGTRAGGWVCVAGAVVCHVCVLDRHGGAIDVVVGLRSKGRRCKLFQDRSNPRRGHDHRGVSHQRARAIGQPRPIRVAQCRCGDFQSRGHRFRVGKEAPCFVCVTAFVLLTVVDGG